MEGWIKIHRKLQEHWIWNEKRKFSKFEAWIDILLRASHKDTKTMLNGKVVLVNKGNFITSEVKLAEKWNWDRSTVRKFLKILEDEKMIQRSATSKYTSISIENWELYQNREQQKEQQNNNKATTEQQQNNTFKNDKNIKNEKNNITSKSKNVNG